MSIIIQVSMPNLTKHKYMHDRNKHFIPELELIPNTSSVSTKLPRTITADFSRQ